jgi:hypothetical protein
MKNSSFSHESDDGPAARCKLVNQQSANQAETFSHFRAERLHCNAGIQSNKRPQQLKCLFAFSMHGLRQSGVE